MHTQATDMIETGPARPPLSIQLQGLVADVTLLQRRLATAVIAGDDRLAAALSDSVRGRLAQAQAAFARRGVETAAILALRARLADGMRGVGDTLAASTLFLSAAYQVLAAIAPRHEPQIGEAPGVQAAFEREVAAAA